MRPRRHFCPRRAPLPAPLPPSHAGHQVDVQSSAASLAVGLDECTHGGRQEGDEGGDGGEMGMDDGWGRAPPRGGGGLDLTEEVGGGGEK